MSKYSASVAYGEPVLVDDNDEFYASSDIYPSASASYLNSANESVSVVDSYFFDIIDDLAQDSDFIHDFGPVALPVDQGSSRGVPSVSGSRNSPALPYAVPDRFVVDQGIVSAAASYVNAGFCPSDSFYVDVIEDQAQIHQYNQFVFNEQKQKQQQQRDQLEFQKVQQQDLAASKQQYYAPVGYAVAASCEQKWAEESKSCYMGNPGDYGWDEKEASMEFSPMKAPRLSRRLNRPGKQRNSHATKSSVTAAMKKLCLPSGGAAAGRASAEAMPATAAALIKGGGGVGPSLAKSRAAALRQRVEGKFKKVQTKWVAAADFFTKSNSSSSSSPVLPYSAAAAAATPGVKTESHQHLVNYLPNFPPASSASSASYGAASRGGSGSGALVGGGVNRWNQPPFLQDYGMPSHAGWHAGGGGSAGSKSLFSKPGGHFDQES